MPSIHPMDEAKAIDAEANRLEKELDQTAQVLGQANDALSKALKENERLRAALAEAERERDQAKRNSEDLWDQLADTERERNALRDENAAIRTTIAALQKSHDALRELIEEIDDFGFDGDAHIQARIDAALERKP